MERRLIRVEGLAEQAGIAAALKRAFAAPKVPACADEDDPFEMLLKAIH